MSDNELSDLILQTKEPLASFEEAWALWQKTIGMARDRYAGAAKKQRPKKTKKILVIPDLHVPFHEPAMVAQMLAQEPDVDHAICIGDIGDSYALSRFVKYEAMPYREEWAAVTAVMQGLSEALPSLEIIIGNHDARLERQLRNHLTEDMVDAIRFMTGGILCPITALSKKFKNITIAHHQLSDGHSADWFTTIGDAWLGHPEKYSRVPGSALRSVEEWIADNEHSMDLARYRLIIMGHTHQASMFPWRSDQLLVEVGCLCALQGYMTSARIGGRPQRRAYLTFEQTDGVTDFNSVRLFLFPNKKKSV